MSIVLLDDQPSRCIRRPRRGARRIRQLAIKRQHRGEWAVGGNRKTVIKSTCCHVRVTDVTSHPSRRCSSYLLELIAFSGPCKQNITMSPGTMSFGSRNAFDPKRTLTATSTSRNCHWTLPASWLRAHRSCLFLEAAENDPHILTTPLRTSRCDRSARMASGSARKSVLYVVGSLSLVLGLLPTNAGLRLLDAKLTTPFPSLWLSLNPSPSYTLQTPESHAPLCFTAQHDETLNGVWQAYARPPHVGAVILTSNI